MNQQLEDIVSFSSSFVYQTKTFDVVVTLQTCVGQVPVSNPCCNTGYPVILELLLSLTYIVPLPLLFNSI